MRDTSRTMMTPDIPKKEDLTWIPVERPWRDFGILIALTTVAVIIAFPIVFIIRNFSSWVVLMVIFILMLTFLGIGLVDVIVAVSINPDFMAVQRASKQIRVAKWNDIEDIRPNEGRNYIALKFGRRDLVSFYLNKFFVEQIIKVWEEKTGKKVKSYCVSL